MKVPYMNLGQQPAGTVVEVIMQGGEAFVEVLDDNNLGLLTDGQVHTYFGGPINGTFQCTLPTTGIWYVLGVSTAGPTQAQIFTTPPTPNSARMPWSRGYDILDAANNTLPAEFQSGPMPDGTATAMGNKFSNSPQFNSPMQGGGDDPSQPGEPTLLDKLFPTSDDHNVGQSPVGGLTDTLNRMNQPPAPADRFSAAEGYIFNEMDTNRRSQAVNDMKAHLTPPISAIDLYLAADAWKDKVKAGAAWDHKPQIEQLFGITSPDKLDGNHYFQQPGTNRAVLYDIYSNIHYGYIGRIAGFPTETLVWGATRGTAETGQNDDGDLITMRGGAALFEQFGPNMTAAQFHQGLMSIVDQLAAAQEAGQSVPQIKYVP